MDICLNCNVEAAMRLKGDQETIHIMIKRLFTTGKGIYNRLYFSAASLQKRDGVNLSKMESYLLFYLFVHYICVTCFLLSSLSYKTNLAHYSIILIAD